MAPDGTVAFPAAVTVDGEFRAAVQIRPPGGPLGDPMLLSEPGTASGAGWVAAGGDGRIVAAWIEDGDLKVATLMPGAASFGPPLTFTDDTPVTAIVRADANGNAIVAWTSHDPVNGGGELARLKATAIPADGGPPATQLVDEVNAPSGITASFDYLSFGMNASGGAVIAALRTVESSTTHADFLSTSLRQPGGSFSTPPNPAVAQAAYTKPNPVDGDSSMAGVQASINDAGDVEASFFKGYYNPTSSFVPPDIDVAAGTLAGGFGVPDPAPVDSRHLWTTDIQSVIDPAGRTTLGMRLKVSGPVRSVLIFRSKDGTWSSPQIPLPTGDQSATNELAVAPDGHELVALTVYGTTGTLYAATADPGGSFGTPQFLATGLDSVQRAHPAFGPSGDGLIDWVFQSGTDYVTDAAGYDVSPPVLRNLAVPASAAVGIPAAFSAEALDIWGPVTTSWSFGDGGSANGLSASHTFDTAADRTVSVTATDAVGNTSTASGSTSVGAPSSPVEAGPAPAGADRTPPLVSRFVASPAVFATGSKPTALVAKVARGTRLRFKLSESAAVAIRIARQVPGLRRRSRCVPATAKLRKAILETSGKRGLRRATCKAYEGRGTLKRTGVAGQNSVAFSGKLGRRTLRVGRYRATLVATDAAKNSSAPANTSFKIVPGRGNV
jgi:hypothetical protein